MKGQLEWKKVKIVRNELAVYRVYESRCKKFRVIHRHWLYDGPNGYPDRWIAFDVAANRPMSEHRKKSAAIKACQREAW